MAGCDAGRDGGAGGGEASQMAAPSAEVRVVAHLLTSELRTCHCPLLPWLRGRDFLGEMVLATGQAHLASRHLQWGTGTPDSAPQVSKLWGVRAALPCPWRQRPCSMGQGSWPQGEVQSPLDVRVCLGLCGGPGPPSPACHFGEGARICWVGGTWRLCMVGCGACLSGPSDRGLLST